jgi:hypothetical protein
MEDIIMQSNVNVQKLGLSMQRKTAILVLLLFILASAGMGCKMSKEPVYQLAGFHIIGASHFTKAIAADYQDYLRKLDLKEGEFVNSCDYFENDRGEHAIDLKVGAHGKLWVVGYFEFAFPFRFRFECAKLWHD